MGEIQCTLLHLLVAVSKIQKMAMLSLMRLEMFPSFILASPHDHVGLHRSGLALGCFGSVMAPDGIDYFVVHSHGML